MPAQPNILFIIMDTQRRDRLSLYGYERDTSPYFDEFAQQATVFDRAVAPAQWTIPAHGSLFTGLYPNTHQVTQAYSQLSGAHPTLAEILQLADYKTIAFCNNPLLGFLDTKLQRGFDEFYNYAGAYPNRVSDKQRGQIQREMLANFRKFARYMVNQFVQHDWLFRLFVVNPLVVPWGSRLTNFKGDSGRSIDDLITYWHQHQAGDTEQPLFAYLNLMGTHTPLRPQKKYLEYIAPDIANNKHAAQYMARFNADAAAWLSPSEEPMTDWQHRTMDAYYDAEIAQQDVQLGRLFKYLRDSDALDNTLVIVAADHGEGHGDHGYHGHSFVVYQELVHVPLTIHYPERFPLGQTISNNVSTRRLFHTILDAANVTPPLAEDDPNINVQQLSLAQALNQQDDVEHGIAFSEAVSPLTLLNVLVDKAPEIVAERHLAETRRGVYVGDHKLAMVGEQVEHLFDVSADPQEIQDIAPEHPEVVTALQATMSHFVQQTAANRSDQTSQSTISDEVMANLRALGYVD